MARDLANPIPGAGAVYCFCTAPHTEFSPRTTGRIGAFKVLGSNEGCIVIGVLDFIGSQLPSLEDLHGCEIMREQRFAHRARAAVWGVPVDMWEPSQLDSMTLLGTLAVRAEEVQFALNIFNCLPGATFSTLFRVNYSSEGEWRWTHDREALVAEQALFDAREAAQRAAQEERYQTRLRGLTWEQLLGETPFKEWSGPPSYPSEEFTRGARDVVHGTCRALRDLGSKPRKADVRKILRECVEWFNKADERDGGAIETEEREDICEVLEEMAFVARQKSLVDEIGEWRTW